MAPVAVRFSDVVYEYGPARRAALDGFTLTLDRGESLALVGASGAGKSTVLRLVNRMLLPSSGTVEVDGRDTRAWDPVQLRRRTGYVIQEIALFPHLTVEENVSVVPRLEGWPIARRRVRARDLLDLVGLDPDEFAPRHPRELSGGQRQRVGVARALAASPPVLLMDEPFGALDPLTRVELQREFQRIRRELGQTVLLVTHDMTEARALGDRVGVLEGGRLVACETATAIARSSDVRVRRFFETAAPPADPA